MARRKFKQAQHYRTSKRGKKFKAGRGSKKVKVRRSRLNNYSSSPLLDTRKKIIEKGSPYNLDSFDIKHVKKLKRLSEKGEFPEDPDVKKFRKEAGLFRFPTDLEGAKAASRQREQLDHDLPPTKSDYGTEWLHSLSDDDLEGTGHIRESDGRIRKMDSVERELYEP